MARGMGLAWLGVVALVCAGQAGADIYQWEWVNPKRPKLGRQAGEVVLYAGSIQPGTWVGGDLTRAYLVGADLSQINRGVYYPGSPPILTLTEADLTGANLTGAGLGRTDVRGAILTDALVSGASFDASLTAKQLYATRSYKEGNLAGVSLSGKLAGWKLAGQDLVGAKLGNQQADGNSDLRKIDLRGADLTGATLRGRVGGARLNGATIKNADLGGAVGLQAKQIYVTASYQQKDLGAVSFYGGNLAGWKLAGQNLAGAMLYGVDLSGADLSGADLTGANFNDATLAGTTLSGAQIQSASLAGAGLTAEQLYSTLSYAGKDLRGVKLWGEDLAGWNLKGQNLAEAGLNGAKLAGAELTGASIQGADLARTTQGGLTAEQVYSTASYQQKNLRGTKWWDNDLSGWNLAGQDLRGTIFVGAKLEGVNFSDAEIGGAGLGEATQHGFTAEQLYSTANYKRGDLREVTLAGNQMQGWDFSGKDLEGLALTGADMKAANFSQANLANCNFSGVPVAGANFEGAEIARALLVDSGLSVQQLYSTANYRRGDLSGVTFGDLTGGDLREMRVAEARFSGDLIDLNLEGADLTDSRFAPKQITEMNLRGADLRGSNLQVRLPDDTWMYGTSGERLVVFGPSVSSGWDSSSGGAMDISSSVQSLTRRPNAYGENMIWPDGHVEGLDLSGGKTLVVRDYGGDGVAAPGSSGIAIRQEMLMGQGGTLRMEFEEDAGSR